MASLDRPVEITFDTMGIPQIWAETEHDGYFALGYLHAADRTFQMDLIRRVAAGRISEMLGDMTLALDVS
jgi:penicillin amidase